MTPNTGKEVWSALLRRDPPPPPDPGAAQRTVTLLRTLPPAAPGGWTFVWRQAGFIRKRMWVLQFVLLAGVLALVGHSEALPLLRRYALCAAAAPLLLVANVQDLSRVYHQGMVELELATRYSLPRITAARLLVFGLCDGVLLAVVAAVGAAATRTQLWVVLLYCLTPFCGVSALCVALLRYLRPAAFSRAALGVVGGAWLVLLLPLSAFQHSLYAPQHQPLWAGALAVSLAALVWQTHRLTRTGPRTCL